MYGQGGEAWQVLYLLMHVYDKDVDHVGPQNLCLFFKNNKYLLHLHIDFVETDETRFGLDYTLMLLFF